MSLINTAQSKGIRYFLVSYSDLLGTSRSKLIPAAAIDEVCKQGAPFAGFATWLDLTPADPDIFAIPDPDSLIQLPWKPEVGWMAADLWIDGRPLAHAPRNVLQRSIEKAADRGFEMRTGVECEFFLLSRDGESVGDPFDDQQKPCYDQQALMRRYELVTSICDALSQLGWQPYQNDHEDANGQFEINFKYSSALETADRQTFFKFLVKSMAEQHGLRATFMPKPFSKLTGNGCHIHVSVWDRAKGVNLFQDAKDELGLSPMAYEFLGGVLHSAEALSAIVTPTVNSYRRIHARGTSSGATWSPNTISYAGNNRTHMIRIPDGGRFELRLADGSANPYIMSAALLEAGLDGLDNHRHPGPPSTTNAYFDKIPEGMRSLPDNLFDSLRALQQDKILSAGLGRDFTDSYLKLKLAEWRDYSSHVSKWETEHTLDC
jgi:glutamine synthetase